MPIIWARAGNSPVTPIPEGETKDNGYADEESRPVRRIRTRQEDTDVKAKYRVGLLIVACVVVALGFVAISRVAQIGQSDGSIDQVGVPPGPYEPSCTGVVVRLSSNSEVRKPSL